MAENTVSYPASNVNENNSIHIAFLNRKMPVVSSLDVALHFQKKHSNVLREIERLRSILPKSFTGLNFELSEYTDPTGRKLRSFHLTRDAFSLLVMGFTGKAAIQWKLRYIEAFNALESSVQSHQSELAREAGYRQGIDAGRASVLPRLREERSKAAQIALSFTPARKLQLRKALRYADMGLSNREIAKLLGVAHSTINFLMQQGRELGFAPEKAAPQQGSLLGVRA